MGELLYIGLTIYWVRKAWKAGWKGISMAIAFGCLGAQMLFAFVCGMLIVAGGGEVTTQANVIIGIIAWGMIISSWIWLSSLSKKPRRVMEEIKEVQAEVVKR